MTLSGVISQARSIFTGQLRNPWQMLAEPLGCAEPRLKITGLACTFSHHTEKAWTINLCLSDSRSFSLDVSFSAFSSNRRLSDSSRSTLVLHWSNSRRIVSSSASVKNRPVMA